MSDELIGFDYESASRIASVVRRVEAAMPAGPDNSAAQGTIVQDIRITGPLASGFYPGNVETFTASGSGGVWQSLGEVRVYSIGIKLEVDDRVACRFMGPSSDGAFGLFVYAAPIPREEGRWLRITSVTATVDGLFPAVVLLKDGMGGRTDGPEVRFRMLPGFDRVVGGTYWATPNGNVIEGEGGSAVTLDVYDGDANVDHRVYDCDSSGAQICYRWSVYGPLSVVQVDCTTGVPV